MKTIVTIFAVMISLISFNAAAAGKPCNSEKCKTATTNDKATVKALRAVAKAAKLENVAFVAVFDIDGNVVLLNTDESDKDSKGKFVIEKKKFKPDFPLKVRGKATNITVTPFEGSTCVRWAYDVVIGGTYYESYCKRYQ